LQIRAVFNKAVHAGTQSSAVVISDKLLTFQSDGKKIDVAEIEDLVKDLVNCRFSLKNLLY